MLSVEGKNYYEMLHVTRKATGEEIRAAYKEIARVFHPDSNFYDEIAELPLSEEHERVFKLLTDAYNTLMNPEKRREYDKTLPPELRRWEEDEEEIEVEIDLRKLKADETRERKPSGCFAVSRFSTLNEEFLENLDARSPTVVVKAVPLKEMLKREREATYERRLVQLSVALCVISTLVSLAVYAIV